MNRDNISCADNSYADVGDTGTDELASHNLSQNPTPETEGFTVESDGNESSSYESEVDDDEADQPNFYYMSGPPASMGSLMDTKAPGNGPATQSLPDLPEQSDDDISMDSQLICLSDLSDDNQGSPQRTPSGRVIAADRRINDASSFRFV